MTEHRRAAHAALRSGGGSEAGANVARDQSDLLRRERLARDLQRGPQGGGGKDRDAVNQQLAPPRQASDMDAQHRVEMQVGAKAEGLGDLGGLPPQRRQRPIEGSAAMPQVASGVA